MNSRFGVILLILVAFTQSVWAKDVIYWQTFHSAPSTIKMGKFAEQGFVDLALKMVVAEMPQYVHETELTTLARALENIKQRKNVCHPSLLMNQQRMEYAYFAHPSIISPSNKIVITQAIANDLNFVSPVDLSEILSNPALSIALVQGRSYGALIDEHVQKIKVIGADRLMDISTERLDTLLRLVESRKVSMTFTYPFELSYFYSEHPEAEKSMVSFSVKGAQNYALGSIACAKTPWGLKVIEDVNKAVLNVRRKPEYLKAMTTWWEKERDLPEFQSYYNDEFLRSTVHQ